MDRKRLRRQERNRRHRRRRLQEEGPHVSESEESSSSESDAGSANSDLGAAVETESEAEDQNSSEADGDQDDEALDQAVEGASDWEVEDDQPEHHLNNSADSGNDEHSSDQLEQPSADSGSDETDSGESAISQGETGSSESESNDESEEEVAEHANSEESDVGSEEEREEYEDRNDPIYPGAPITLIETSVCKKCRKSGENATFFIELPLLQQLQSFFNKDSFFQDLQFRFKYDRKASEENIEDIFDGNIYKDEMNNGFLRNPNNLSFMWYSDGIKIFKSSSFSVWPLCLVINELPYKKRSHPDNILLIGLWFGKSKPNPNVYLRPLLKTMKKFESDGHVFKLPNNREILVKGKILCGTCDLPAKAKFLQFKQYNGAFGCARCMQEGARAVAGKTTVQVYPYEPDVPMRTHEQTKLFAAEALEARTRNRNASVSGVKGPSLLTKLVPDIIRCTVIDIMHGCFLGVARLLVDLLFSSSFSTQPWSLHHLFDVADEKLKKIKPPSYAARAPRSLKEIKFWKASEYKLFLLYYSVALLHGLMENRYLQHHCKLVSAISLLCQDSISLTQVDLACNLLRSYVQDFPRLYSIRYLGINVHQLLHLSDCVTDLGPLWVYSCFYLENYNGTINKLCHGTQHIALQICSAVSMLIQMPTFMKSLPPDSSVIQYCTKLTNNFKPFKISDVMDNSIYAVGHYYGERRQVDHSRLILRQCFNLVAGSCKVFYRLKLKGVMYFCKEYPICSVRNESSYIKISEGNQVHFGRIIRFVRWSNCGNLCDVDCINCPFTFYAIVAVMRREFWFAHDIRDVRFTYIFKVSHTDTVKAFDVRSITSLCFCFEVDDETFLCSPINRLECE
ncbi:Halomucin [Frankliniella fusca]|uniref:Halomucin n=1 Tax=Frankliniella fusca TaxID=407009 RepID=A0AAE1GWT0_9NEOP|nr:Halomucin [Frankliniella fusca]